MLDVLVVNLKEVNRHEELGKGTLYVSLCKKLNESALAHYHRWMYENGRWESVETLKEFIVRVAEFQTVASETIRVVNTAIGRIARGRRSLVEIRKWKATEKQQTCHALVKYVMDRMEFGDARSSKP